jgi:hypothetical protein
MPDLRLPLALIALFTWPGVALLAGTRYAQTLSALQRWIVAVALSLTLIPVLFYALRAFAPNLPIFAPQLIGGLSVCALWIAWRWRHGEWRGWLQLEPLEWVAVGVMGATVFTRFWIIRDQPYPAWSDSLHHVLLTQLTATRGGLPATLEPYAPIPLDQYHLGLYALSASAQNLAQAPAHTALLWTAQTLNGLCAIGLYFVLDRKVGRVGALVGAVAAGLLSHQPAWYVNWGRFTQLAAQVPLLIAWLLLWEAWRIWRAQPRQAGWPTFASAILVSGIALLHFRVAAFLAPLAVMVGLYEGYLALKNRQLRTWLIGIAAMGGIVLWCISPALWDALRVYAAASATPTNAVSQAIYYDWSTENFPLLMARPWLMWLALACAGIAALRRQPLLWLTLGWLVALTAIGNSYVLGIKALNIVNFSGALIMFYLPIALLLGLAAESALARLAKYRAQLTPVFLTATLLAGFAAGQARSLEIEPFRYFVTPADLPALDWINHNTPPDARIAINIVFWFPAFPHGTDAGYWIPYFTGRSTNAVSMLLNFAPADYRTRAKQASEAVRKLETDLSAVAELKALGYDYVYVGARGNFERPGLNPALLQQSPDLTQVYAAEGVAIFAIK